MKLDDSPGRDGYSDLGGVLMFGWKFRQPPDSQIAKKKKQTNKFVTYIQTKFSVLPSNQ